LGGWTIKRTVDGQDKVTLVLDEDLTLKAGGRMKVGYLFVHVVKSLKY